MSESLIEEIRTVYLHPSLYLGCRVIMMLQVFPIEMLLQCCTEVEIIRHRVWPESWKGKTFPPFCGEVTDSVLECTWHSSVPGPCGGSERMLTLDRTGATGGSSLDKSHSESRFLLSWE